MKKIVFVYNADSGIFNAAIDWVHKIISPRTYQCSLCAITYDNLGMKKKWKRFIDSQNIEAEFLHKDEFENKYPEMKNIKLAAVFEEKDGQIETIIDAETMNKFKNLEELISHLQKILK